MENLQAEAQPSRLQMQLAQSAALVEFVADEQRFTIQRGADRFQIRIHRQRTQLRHGIPAIPDPGSQSIHQGMQLKGWG